jgi:xanthine dehydrogenase YagS FAD-binding subunit
VRLFDYFRANSIAEAAREASTGGTSYLAGGTNLVDLMKEDVERPSKIVDLNWLALKKIERMQDGGLLIGALVTNADTAYHPEVTKHYPVLASAILAGASPQLRNAATTGGNLNQRTRCYYFYDAAAPCNKRRPGSGCGAIGGVNRHNAILGASEQCIATHPSDMCVALAVLDARVHLSGLKNDRVVAIGDYHRLPGDEPWRDTVLASGELVTGIELPDNTFTDRYTYLKLRDRLSYAFALVSVAVVMRMHGGVIEEGRVALGGVAHKPWRRPDAEALLRGQPSDKKFTEFADAILAGATGQGENNFKIPLARRAIVRACHQAANGTPQSQTDKRIA